MLPGGGVLPGHMSEVIFSTSILRIAAVVLKPGAGLSDHEMFSTLVSELGVARIVLARIGSVYDTP